MYGVALQTLKEKAILNVKASMHHDAFNKFVVQFESEP